MVRKASTGLRDLQVQGRGGMMRWEQRRRRQGQGEVPDGSLEPVNRSHTEWQA